MEVLVEGMRSYAFDFWNDVLLMYRTMVIKAELRRRKTIADSQDREDKRRKADLLLGQHEDCLKGSHSIKCLHFSNGTSGTMHNCDRSEMRQVFDLFDENKDGFICATELQQFMKKLGFELSEQTVTDMVKSVDANSDNCMDFEEFLSLYSSLCELEGRNSTKGDHKRRPTIGEDDDEANLLKAFFVFDENKDGLISVLELQQVLLKLGLPEGKSLISCQRMIERVDSDGNGKVDFFEFKDMMSSNAFSFCNS
ncbi:unnamed protein product [Calypogeia fissa]